MGSTPIPATMSRYVDNTENSMAVLVRPEVTFLDQAEVYIYGSEDILDAKFIVINQNWLSFNTKDGRKFWVPREAISKIVVLNPDPT